MNLITPSFGLIFWQTIIFLLMLYILRKFAWRPILNFLETREKYIENSLDKAKFIRNEMYHLQFYKEHWIKESKIQRDFLLIEARNMSNLIKLQAIQRDKSDKKELILQTKLIMENEKKNAKNHIKKLIAKLAISISEKLIKKEIKNDKEQKDVILNLIDINALDQIRSSI